MTPPNNKGRRGRGTPKRRRTQRNGAAAGQGLSSLVRRGNAAGLSRIPGLGFPHSMLSNLRYCDIITLTSTSGAFAKNIFRWNSTFDPDLTGTGHQPLFRDTFAAIYDQYAVVSASIEVQFINNSTSPLVCGLSNEDSSNTPSTVDAVMEQAEGQHQLLPPQTGSLSSHTFRMNWDCKKMLRIDPFASETYKTAVGSNPTEESDVAVWCFTPDGSTATITFAVTLVQHVLWTELTTPTQS